MRYHLKQYLAALLTLILVAQAPLVMAISCVTTQLEAGNLADDSAEGAGIKRLLDQVDRKTRCVGTEDIVESIVSHGQQIDGGTLATLRREVPGQVKIFASDAEPFEFGKQPLDVGAPSLNGELSRTDSIAISGEDRAGC